jgi:glutaminyl-tRNA synthetase
MFPNVPMPGVTERLDLRKSSRPTIQRQHAGRVAARFPPEPNGYLHIGHAKSIAVNFGIARISAHVTSVRRHQSETGETGTSNRSGDIRWLGFLGRPLYYASDYWKL